MVDIIDSFKKNIYDLLDNSIKNNPPEVVLLSGGIDSSVVAFIAKKYNPNLVCITIATQDTESPDIKYAKLVAKTLGIKNHIIVDIKKEEIDGLVKDVARTLGNFNIFWVSAAVVLYKGLITAKEAGFKTVATGEGSDDLFGSFPVMVNWQYGEDELIKFINTRMKDIDLMTQKVSSGLGVNILLPFHDAALRDFALKIPLGLRTNRAPDGKVTTKYVFRETFKEYLPADVINRPQTMAFIGASTLDYLTNKYSNVFKEAEFREKYGINFASSYECYLFSILNGAGKYKSADESGPGICLYCKSKLRDTDSVHCPVCGTLQYKNKILPF